MFSFSIQLKKLLIGYQPVWSILVGLSLSVKSTIGRPLHFCTFLYLTYLSVLAINIAHEQHPTKKTKGL